MHDAPVSQNDDTPSREKAESCSSNDKPLRIGLALSGGGFRASLFHLGVIRRLEELGIMKRVHTISAVSGGSIIAAYYVIEMEKRLRRRRDAVKDPQQLDKVRLQIFKEIADCFFKALDHNLRSRALAFGPFYHPILWIKSLWPTLSRSDIMQKEYDRWFYHDETLDQMPSVTLPSDNIPGEVETDSLVLTGPTVVLNATSLLTGERKGFQREPVSGLNELGRVNRNVLKLSNVVGASSGVPGIFPPTTILGDKLVDGGVSGNQGIDALVNLDRVLNRLLDRDECPAAGSDKGSAADCDDFDVLLVSDASGQMEMKHRLGIRTFKVMLRTVSVFQFQLRRKTLKILRLWKGRADSGREFAFVHLFLNLKDRPQTPRVPSEYIPALGGIRTDLDQFSFIEREALMYHGYTLMDAQIQEHCERLKALIPSGGQALEQPPLFRDQSNSDGPAEQCDSETVLRKRVKDVLTTGSAGLFLWRSRRKYPKKSWLVFGPALSVFGAEVWLSCVVADWGRWLLEIHLAICHFPLDTRMLTTVALIALWGYLDIFLTYVVMRPGGAPLGSQGVSVTNRRETHRSLDHKRRPSNRRISSKVVARGCLGAVLEVQSIIGRRAGMDRMHEARRSATALTEAEVFALCPFGLYALHAMVYRQNIE